MVWINRLVQLISVVAVGSYLYLLLTDRDPDRSFFVATGLLVMISVLTQWSVSRERTRGGERERR